MYKTQRISPTSLHSFHSHIHTHTSTSTRTSISTSTSISLYSLSQYPLQFSTSSSASLSHSLSHPPSSFLSTRSLNTNLSTKIRTFAFFRSLSSSSYSSSSSSSLLPFSSSSSSSLSFSSGISSKHSFQLHSHLQSLSLSLSQQQQQQKSRYSTFSLLKSSLTSSSSSSSYHISPSLQLLSHRSFYHPRSQLISSRKFSFKSSFLLLSTNPINQNSNFNSLSSSSSNPNTEDSTMTSENQVRLAKQAQKARRKHQRKLFIRAALVVFVALVVYNLVPEAKGTRSWQLGVMKTLPLNLMSQAWGLVHSYTLPVFLRSPIYHFWSYVFDCNLDECELPLEEYKNLKEFFIRHLKPNARPIANDAEMVSPVDGRVSIFGRVDESNDMQQIKGMNYSLIDFLGFIPPPYIPEKHSNDIPTPDSPISISEPDDEISQTKVAAEASPAAPHRKLYYVVYYLAPGDYHRIHSPINATYTHRHHHPGHLFPVAPTIIRWVPSIFVRNERVIVSGYWNHGWIGVGCVGALNVGSVKLNYDENLVTNKRHRMRLHLNETRAQRKKREEEEPYGEGHGGYVRRYGSAELHNNTAISLKPPHIREGRDGLHMDMGEEFARFELGSTVVVIFELKEDEEWNWMVNPHDKVKVGQKVGYISKKTNMQA